MTTESAESELEVLAIVAGKPFTELPHDLFIPPDALEVLLDSFSGPLDLLLYLIRRQNIDILNIPITLITQQYMQYIHLMERRRMELAADYLVMAALLAEIKSRMLLPSHSEQQDEEEEDPRMTLVRRLQAYEQIKTVALLIDALPRYERDVFQVQLSPIGVDTEKIYPTVKLTELTMVFADLLQSQLHKEHHQVICEPLSVRERMTEVFEHLQGGRLVEFHSLLIIAEGRRGLVVTLLAVLELSRQSLLVMTQTDNFAPIYLKVAHHG
ncbi:segregation and condensation protein A [Legionella oakridgensis]|nr:ScpA family protein [Legionella oakridgensis]ETO93064.1 condensin, subunit ScpA [Legionella oakridgensis RV-2-2007]KTD37900.1 segregation and condensation protein A [Legionella oakridgensis]STY20378.1 segregation and condensation protein A [Legionella longbeachae]